MLRRPVLAAVVVFATASASGCGQTKHARPPVEPSAGVRVAVIGDFGVGRTDERALGAAVRAQKPDALVTVGDNNYASPSSFLINWRQAFGWTRKLPLVASLGNHDADIDGGTYELRTLRMPGRHYTRRVGAAEFVVLDSNSVDAEQTAFLRRELAGSTAAWTIPVFHHPPYLCGAERPNLDVRRAWLPLFRRYDVRLVLNGHDHDYERFRQGPTTFVVDGGGAATLYPLRPCRPGTPPLLASDSSEHTFLLLDISSSTLRVEVVAVHGGGVVDSFTIER